MKRRALTFRQFANANVRRCTSPSGFNHKLSDWSASDWMVATMGELGEAANVLKKLNRCRDGINGNKETRAQLVAKLRQEIGDVFVYLDLFARSQGFSIEEAAREVFNTKSREIGYRSKLK